MPLGVSGGGWRFTDRSECLDFSTHIPSLLASALALMVWVLMEANRPQFNSPKRMPA